jgi:hypothetical protein
MRLPSLAHDAREARVIVIFALRIDFNAFGAQRFEQRVHNMPGPALTGTAHLGPGFNRLILIFVSRALKLARWRRLTAAERVS